MSEPARLFGFTYDEIGLILLGLFFIVFFSSIVHKLIVLLSTAKIVYGIRKFKSFISGFSLNSFLNWHVGSLLKIDSENEFPESSKRVWII